MINKTTMLVGISLTIIFGVAIGYQLQIEKLREDHYLQIKNLKLEHEAKTLVLRKTVKNSILKYEKVLAERDSLRKTSADIELERNKIYIDAVNQYAQTLNEVLGDKEFNRIQNKMQNYYMKLMKEAEKEMTFE
jgi:hypothetical protein